MHDEDVLALAPAAAARLPALRALSDEASQAFCADAQREAVTTVFATGELFSPDPLGPELYRSVRGTIAAPDAAHRIAFQFDAEGRLVTSWNRSRFFRHAAGAIDELRVRRGATFKVGVVACYVLGDDGGVSEWASANAEGKRMGCRYERDADGRIARVVRAVSDWESPEAHLVAYATTGRDGSPAGTAPAEIVSERTGAMTYAASARWSSELLAHFTRLLADEATRAIRGVREPLYCLAIGYHLTSSSGCCPPWLVGGPERVRARLPAAERYSPLVFGAPELGPIALPLSPRFLEVASRIRLAIPDETQLSQLERAYTSVALALNEARPWTADGARPMPEHFVVFATDVANGDHLKHLDRCLTPGQRAGLLRAGLL